MASDAPIDPARCPLCGEGNACGMAAGAGTCWCFGIGVSPEAIERVPAEARDRACLCRSCASGRRSPAEALAVIRDPVRGR